MNSIKRIPKGLHSLSIPQMASEVTSEASYEGLQLIKAKVQRLTHRRYTFYFRRGDFRATCFFREFDRPSLKTIISYKLKSTDDISNGYDALNRFIGSVSKGFHSFKRDSEPIEDAYGEILAKYTDASELESVDFEALERLIPEGPIQSVDVPK